MFLHTLQMGPTWITPPYAFFGWAIQDPYLFWRYSWFLLCFKSLESLTIHLFCNNPFTFLVSIFPCPAIIWLELMNMRTTRNPSSWHWVQETLWLLEHDQSIIFKKKEVGQTFFSSLNVFSKNPIKHGNKKSSLYYFLKLINIQSLHFQGLENGVILILLFSIWISTICWCHSVMGPSNQMTLAAAIIARLGFGVRSLGFYFVLLH